MRRLVTVAAAVLVGLVGVAASAAALKTKSASTTIASGDDGSATAKCKRGTEAVAGGFKSPGFITPLDSVAGPAVFSFESRRDGRRTLLGSAHNSGSDTGTLVVQTYCDTDKPRLKTLSASSATIDFLDDDSATARCGKGSEAVWGGFDSPDLSIGSSREGRRKWTASAVNFNDPAPLTVYAYCDKSEPGLKTKAKSTTIGHDQVGTATAKCKRGSEAVSGGYFAPGGFDLDVGSEIYFYESHRKGKRKWTASGLNQGDPAKLTTFAYCAPKD
jgi:phage terminase large subunit-like protein